jgi:peptide/nickel transport system substrate-binding protein
LRQALALCTDRTTLVERLFLGATRVPATFASPLSPLANPEVVATAYDPERGRQILESLGWRLPTAGLSTVRVAYNVRGVTAGTPLRLDLYAVSGVQRRAAVEMLAANLAECGVGLNVQFTDSGLLRAGNEGAVFGRQFSMAQFTWLSGPTPSCELYLSREIPSAENGWIGQNATGFSDPAYDAACESALAALPGEAAYTEGFRRAQEIFLGALPSLPLYLKLRVLAGRPDLLGLQADPTSASGLWNIEALSLGDVAPQ